MYVPKHFHEPSVPVLHELMRDYPLASLVNYSEDDGLTANQIPLYLEPEMGAFGTLRGHVARANPVWQAADATNVLVIFNGPQAYVSPSWYATKQETGKVVPTWNYAVVHAHGVLSVKEDVSWLHAHLETLTQRHEADFPKPWNVSDAPTDYTDGLIKAIVGIEIEITKLVGKWKVSQNQPSRNQVGVVTGLSASASAHDEARQMADLVQARIKPL